jgi:FMN reductase
MTGLRAEPTTRMSNGPRRAPRVAVVVGNPQPGSRTHAAAMFLASQLADAEPETDIDLCDHGPALLNGDPVAMGLIDRVRAADLVVVASPTYKATYTGLLKLFLDRIPSGGLRGVVAVPMMLGAGPEHALAPEHGLRPVLTELGATVPVPGLYVLETAYDDATSYSEWLDVARPPIAAALAAFAEVA